jgi:hypothetical protein
MKEAAREVVPYEEVERQCRDEWVLVEVVKPHSDYRKQRVRLIAHSAERDDLDEPYWKARKAAPKAILGQFYTGKVAIPEGMSVVL